MTPGRTILTALAETSATTGQLNQALPGMTMDRLSSCLRTLRGRALIHTAGGVHGLTGKGRAWLEAGLEIQSGPRTGRAASRTSGTLRAKAWRTLRIRRKASLDDILLLVADGGEKHPAANLRRYLTALFRAGILLRTRSGWVLPEGRNTGPEAPAWNSKTKTVIDVNTGEQWRIG